jgi:hypothetical protein
MRIYVAEARAAWSRSAEGEGDSSGYRCPKSATLLLRLDWRSIVSGNVFNSEGIHVAMVSGQDIFDLTGNKLYNLKGGNIYRLSANWSGI